MPIAPNVAAAWKKRSTWLAGWTAAQLLNRNDLWARYLPEGKQKTVDGNVQISRLAPLPAKRGILRLGERALTRHFSAEDRVNLIGIQSASADNKSRWVAIDLENPVQPILPGESLRAANHWFDELVDLGLSPILIDSDGDGGYHLIVIFRQPISTAVAHEFISAIIRDHAQFRLEQPPVILPNKPVFDENNWLRLPGRHPVKDHWSKVWSRRRWQEGADAVDAILSAHGDAPSLIRKLVSAPSLNSNNSKPVLVTSSPSIPLPTGRLGKTDTIVDTEAEIDADTESDMDTNNADDGRLENRILCYVLAASRKADSPRIDFEPKIDVMSPEDFELPAHRSIFSAISHLRNKSERITPSAIAEDIPSENRDAALSVIDQLIIEKPVTESEFETLVTKVKSRQTRKVPQTPVSIEIPPQAPQAQLQPQPQLNTPDCQKDRLLELWPNLNPAVRQAIVTLAESSK
jgi:hypothetical protein